MSHNLTIYPYLIQVALTSYLGDRSDQDLKDIVLNPKPDGAKRYPIRVIVIGIPNGLNSIIHELYVKQFAQVYEWSTAIRAGQPGEVMKTMARCFVVNS